MVLWQFSRVFSGFLRCSWGCTSPDLANLGNFLLYFFSGFKQFVVVFRTLRDCFFALLLWAV